MKRDIDDVLQSVLVVLKKVTSLDQDIDFIAALLQRTAVLANVAGKKLNSTCADSLEQLHKMELSEFKVEEDIAAARAAIEQVL